MGNTDGKVFIGGDAEVARRKCLKALASAKFKNVRVSDDGFSIRAERQVGTQWTKTPLYVSLIPQEGGTLVTASATASVQSLVSIVRSPSSVIVRKFIDALASA